MRLQDRLENALLDNPKSTRTATSKGIRAEHAAATNLRDRECRLVANVSTVLSAFVPVVLAETIFCTAGTAGDGWFVYELLGSIQFE